MSHADLNTRVQKAQLGAVGKRRLDQITVTPLDNPLIIDFDKFVEFAKTDIQRLAFWAGSQAIVSKERR